jgi:DNA primase
MAIKVDGEIERLKQEISLQELVTLYGVELKNKGKDLVGLCPMHDDKEPSLVITPDKNLWHCLGACQTGGSVIDWVMKIEGVSFRHAVEILKERYAPCNTLDVDVDKKKDAENGVNGGNGKAGKPTHNPVLPKPVKRSTARKLESTFGGSVEGQILLNQVVGFYNETLKDSSEGKDYLQDRGLKNSEIIDRFKLGLSNRTLCYRLPEKNRKSGEILRTNLQDLGILRESGHEHFAGSLVIPIFDEKGNVVEMYGRKIRDDLRKGTAFHLYLPGQHHGVWNFSCLAASKEIILCEALIDALTFWCYGFRNVTASYGVNGFTKDHLEAFKRYGTERVLIAYDADEAGNKAAEALAPLLLAEGMECFRIQFPASMDANQCAQKFKNAEKAFKQLIQNAIRKGKMTNVVMIGDSRPPAAGEEKEIPGTVDKTNNKHTAQNANNVENRAAKEKPAAKEENERPSISLAVSSPGNPEDLRVEKKPGEVHITSGNRFWRFRGLVKKMSYETLKLNAMVKKGDKYYMDSLDLYQARHRANFIKQAAAELGENEEIIKIDLGKMLLKLEEFQDEQIKQTLEPKKKEVAMSEEEKKEALELLKDPKLLDRILEDFRICGVVGEETNKLVGYLAAVSRKLDSPLAILIQSSSAAGKTWLMESVLNFVPEEEKVKYSAMTGQSLFYMGESNLKHKILAIVEEEGAERTRYALKLLQSEGELSIASTGKDPVTGLLGTKEYRVQGPVMVFSTTTNIDIDEELQNRCIILTVDESREQTKAIHQMQRARRTLEGFRAKKEKEKLLKLHRNSQRLLRPLFILNPYAKRLTFLDDKTRTRRDHEKYLSLIDSIAFLHQYQRPLNKVSGSDEEQYIIVTLEDIELANKLANEVLGRSLDELPPQTRLFLDMAHELVSKECEKNEVEQEDYRFTRRQVCEYTRWSLTQVRLHLQRLIDHEYVLVHRGQRGQSFVYELLYQGEGKKGKPFLVGLIDINKLRNKVKPAQSEQAKEPEKVIPVDKEVKKCKYDAEMAGEKEELAGSKRPQNAPKTGGGGGVV